MIKLAHLARLLPLLALLTLILLACSPGNPTGPQDPGTPAAGPGGLLGLLATDVPTATPIPTATATPTATPTPLPTPTPVAALSVGSLPAGQVLFSTQRAGEAGEQLWRVTAADGLVEALSGVLPGGWRCAGEPVNCAFVETDQGLFLWQPVSATVTLLDDLAPVVASLSPSAGLSETVALTAAVGMTDTTLLSSTVGVTGTALLSPTVGVTNAVAFVPAAPIAAAAPFTAAQPISQTFTLPVLALNPAGDRLAVATEERVVVYDLSVPAVLATLDAGGPAELAWSPDGGRLALAYPTGAGNAIALWSLADGGSRVLAQMEAAGHLAWSPDGSKLAFDARTSPGAPASQGNQSDIYVLYLRNGEIGNLTELFLRNNGVDPAAQIAAWAPQWMPDGEAVRYVRGLPDQIAEQNVVSQPLRSRSPTTLWPAAETGALGLTAEPGGGRLARVIQREGRAVVQVGTADGGWQDASPGSFNAVGALAWAPADEGAAAGRLLVADRQTLLFIDLATGAISGLAVACPDCTVTNAVWLPLVQD